MSEAQEVETEDRVDDAPAVNEEVERVARANGWKPKDQWKGRPEEWKNADIFVAHGLENPAILSNRNAYLADKVDRLERIHADTKRDLTTRLDATLESLSTVTQMTRSAEQRAYDRARRELRDQMTHAVESGDTARWRALEQERETLDQNRPAEITPPVARPAPAAPVVAPDTQPEVLAFFQRNPWYHQDRELQTEAEIIHTGLRNARPDLTLDQNLREVERRMQAQFGERARSVGADGIGNGYAEPRRAAAPADLDRRDDPPAVTPSSGGTNTRRAANRFTFDAMPKESKDAFAKYAKQLQGKGEPLTKEEWATTYWDQFRDDGA